MYLQGNLRNVPVKLLGTKLEARKCISDPGTQEPYRDIIFGKKPV
jgi:hypothetical protein